MRFQQLFERASPVLYHYTTAYAALDIVKNNRFQLSIGTANPSEAKLAPPGYDYFISMARTRTGDYHRYAHNGGTIFVLDGNWFNGRYPTKPVDYWERMWLYPGSDRSRESEDRVFSREPTIPADAVQQVHVLIKNFKPSKQNERVRQLLLLCKQRNLPVYFYIDEKAWRLLDTRSAVSPGYYKHLFRGERDAPYVREPDPTKPVMPRPSKARRKVLRSYFSKNYLKSWIELLYKKSSKDLSKDADRLRYDLSYTSWEPNDDNRLGMEISNARKPDGGLSRKSAIEILQYMRSHNLKTTTDFRNMIADKWKQIAQAEREQKKPMAEAKPRSVATKQAMATRSLYRNEDLIEQIWDMKRPRSLPALQTALDMLWDHYSKILGARMIKPELQFGTGVKYHGRYLSFTQSLDRGQRIVLAPGERNLYVLVHELSHALGPSEHGVRFAQVYHDLLNHKTFKKMMQTPAGKQFLEYLRVEHPRQIRRIYRNR